MSRSYEELTERVRLYLKEHEAVTDKFNALSYDIAAAARVNDITAQEADKLVNALCTGEQANVEATQCR